MTGTNLVVSLVREFPGLCVEAIANLTPPVNFVGVSSVAFFDEVNGVIVVTFAVCSGVLDSNFVVVVLIGAAEANIFVGALMSCVVFGKY